MIIGHRPIGKHWWGYLWSITAFFWLSCPLILSLIQFFMESRQIILSSIFFYMIIPVQFGLAVRYHNRSHFESILRDCRLSRIKIPTQIRLLIGIISGLVVCLILLGIIWGVTDSVPHGFEWLIVKLGNDLKNLGYLLMVGNWILAWSTLLSNLAIFMLVFSKHVKDIRGLKDNLETSVIWNLDQSSFTQITRQIIDLRFVISQSIDNLESFYTLTTILGAIALGPIIDLKQINPYLIFNVIVYLLVQVFFIYYIFIISKNREDILKIVKSPTVMFKCLTNIKKMQNIQSCREQQDRSINLSKITAYSSSANLRREIDLENPSSEMEDLVTLGYKNNAGIDWIILQTVLAEKWASFNLLGVSFDDSEVIKKGIGMTSLIVMVSTYFNSMSLLIVN